MKKLFLLILVLFSGTVTSLALADVCENPTYNANAWKFFNPVHSTIAGTAFSAASLDSIAQNLPRGWTLLHHAVVCSEDPGIIAWLIKNGADVNARNKDVEGWTPLHFAVGVRSPEIIALLIKSDADVNAKNKEGWTPLHFAAGVRSPEIIALLIKSGADVNVRSGDGKTPLHFAARYTGIGVERYTGIGVERPGREGWAPLHSAVEFNENPESLTLLIKSGADINARDKRGQTPLHVAADYDSNPEFLALLIEQGADVDARSESESTPLHYAAGGGTILCGGLTWILKTFCC